MPSGCDLGMSENWLPVVGWEDLYEVSDLGRVRSLDRIDAVGRLRRGRVIKAWPDLKGYLRTQLSRSGKYKGVAVHRLVLEAFVGPPPEGQEALHGPAGVANNQLSNLRWGTHSENTYDSVNDGTHPWARRTHCPRNHPLETPNLVPSSLKLGRRQCLACARATSKLGGRGPVSPELLQQESDQYFDVISV